MRSKARALVWEYFAFGWRPILLALAGTLALPLILYWIFLRSFTSQALAGQRIALPNLPGWRTFPSTEIHFILMLIGLLFSVGATLYALETRKRLYVLPITPWFWLAWKLPLAMGTAAAIYLMTAGSIYALYEIEWPFLGPALIFAASVSVIHAALALTRAPFPRLVFGSLFGALLFNWLQTRYRLIVSDSSSETSIVEFGAMWTTATAADLFTLAALAVAGFVVSALAMERERCGEQLIAWKNPFTLAWPAAAPRRFRSPAAAQFWMEWREKGLTLPICVAVVLLCTLAVYGVMRETLQVELYAASLYVLIPLALLSPIVVGLGIGSFNTSARLGQPMNSFRATRPATDAQLSGAALKVSAASLLLSLLILALYSVGLLLWSKSQGQVEQLLNDISRAQRGEAILLSMLLLLVFSVATAWTATGLFTSLALTGRWRWAIWLIGGAALWIVLYVVSRFLSPGFAFLIEWAVHGILWGIGLGCLPATAWAFWSAMRRCAIERETAWISLGLWTAAFLFWLALFLVPSEFQTMRLLAMASLSALPIAPLATAPLAVAWNRHR